MVHPCFASPFRDTGYDVADYLRIAPRYGSNDTMETLVSEPKARGVRVLLDLVAGHTSIAHQWFKDSCADDSDHRYVWAPPAQGADTPPNDAYVASPGPREGSCLKNFFAEQASQAVAHVAAHGHTGFVFLGPQVEPNARGFGPSARIRQELERASNAKGLNFASHLVAQTPSAGRALFRELARSACGRIAVVSFNELAVAGMLYEAALSGFAVPERLTVLVLNMGAGAADLAQPPLTTLSPEPQEIMSQAVSALVQPNGIEGLDPKQPLLMRSHLAIRSTT